MSGVLVVILLVVFVIVAILLVGLVLIQDEGGDGVGGIFGGSSGSAFGSRSGNVLTKTTYILGTIFFVVCFCIAFAYKKPAIAETDGVTEAAKAQNAIETTEAIEEQDAENWFKGEGSTETTGENIDTMTDSAADTSETKTASDATNVAE